MTGNTAAVFDPKVFSGTERKRVRYTAIESPASGGISVMVVPQRVIEAGDDRIEQDLQGFYLPIDALDAFPEIDFVTGQPTGRTLTMQQVCNAWFSAVAWGLSNEHHTA